MKYDLLISRRAQKQMAAIHSTIRARIEARIQTLRDNPRPENCKKLVDRDAWRIRIGDYRVIYEITDEIRLVSVDEVGHRGDIYRSE